MNIDQEIMSLDALIFPKSGTLETWSLDEYEKFVGKMRFLFAGILIGSRATRKQIEKLIKTMEEGKL